MNTNPNIELDNYDFIDFGCSDGSSLRFGMTRLKGHRGLGIDIDDKKVSKTIELGYEAAQADVTKLERMNGKVRFVIMSHFLEHLPSYALAKKCIQTSVEIASEFVIIQQPWFDSDGLLFNLGLKYYWSDWSGHPNRMTSLEFDTILRPMLKKGKIKRYVIYGSQQVTSSEDSSIHPLSSPINSHKWEGAFHDAKPLLQFNFESYRSIKVIILLSDKADLLFLEKALEIQAKIHDSDD